MGLYWRRSTKILPGVRINWSKSGPSVSVGPRGAKLNFGKRGTYVSGGIPGTGLYYRQKIGGGKHQSSSNSGYSYTGSNSAPTYTGGSSMGSFFSGKGCLISIIASIALSLLVSGNFLTLLIFGALCGCAWFFWNKKHQAPTSAPNQPTTPQPANPQVPSSAPTPSQAPAQQDQSNPSDIDIKVAVAEVEHLIGEIDKSSDKIKLPSYYRRLMSIVNKLEKYDNVKIQGLPIDEAKRRILENYRKKMQ